MNTKETHSKWAVGAVKFLPPPHPSIPHFEQISMVFMLLPNIICGIPK